MEELGCAWPRISLRWDTGKEARRFGFAADKIEIPAPSASLLPTFPPSLVTQISQVWEYLRVALVLGLQDTAGVERAISGHKDPICLKPLECRH